MNLKEILFHVITVELIVLPVAALLVVGPTRLWTAVPDLRESVREAMPIFVILGVVLAINSVVRDSGNNLSWIIGFNITGHIHAIEGQFVAQLQSLATPTLTAYFSNIYVFGYTFLLVFPLLAYLLAEEPRPLYETVLAYIANYSIGLLCYVVFIAYGPRNFIPELVDPLLYTNWPQSQLLTSEVNTNTNVFPSLHTSLSVTVAILAYRFREIYPRWIPLAWVLAGSVVISTMYLGIHWLTDVVAGCLLAVVAVTVARRFSGRLSREPWEALGVDRLKRSLLTRVRRRND